MPAMLAELVGDIVGDVLWLLWCCNVEKEAVAMWPGVWRIMVRVFWRLGYVSSQCPTSVCPQPEDCRQRIMKCMSLDPELQDRTMAGDARAHEHA